MRKCISSATGHQKGSLFFIAYSTYICSTCRDQLPDLYLLVQHVQTAHNIRIYAEEVPNETGDVHKVNNSQMENAGFADWLASKT